ncbi:hypothetical protein C500_21225 [Natrialba magadii ATCC 43099]|nr:hypothetical protein C500_21225 [Natrialba magadii ATCC 43099]
MTAQDNASETLDDVEEKGGETAESMEEVEESSEGVSRGFDSIDRAGVALSGTLAGTGVALQGVLDRTSELRGSLALTAGMMDDVDGSVDALAASMSDATFPTQDVVLTMEELRHLGVETEEEMENVALAADQLADATGSSASVIAGSLAPSIQALDGDLDALEDRSDAFTLALNDSRLEAQDLNSVVQRSSQELQELGLTSDETAGLISMYAQANQVEGTQAARQFREAIRESNGDLNELKDELNLSEDALDEWNETVMENEGETERLADEYAETKTVMDELRVVASDLQLRFSGVLQPLSALPPVLFAAGSAGLFYSTVLQSSAVPATVTSTAATTANTAALTGKTAALRTASGAQTLMTMSTASLATATRAKTASMWASVTGMGASAVAALSAASAKGILTAATGGLTAGVLALNAALGPIGAAFLLVGAATAALIGLWKTDLFGAGDAAAGVLGRIRSGASTLVAIVQELIGILYELGRIALTLPVMALLAPFAAALNFLEDPSRWLQAGREIPSMIASGISSAASAPIDAVSNVASGIRDRLPFSPALAGPLQDLDRVGPALVGTITDGIRDRASAPVDAVTDVASGVRDRLPFSPALAGPLQDVDEVGGSLMGTIAGDVEGEGGTLSSALESTLGQTPLGEAAGSAAGAVGDALGGGGGGGGGEHIEITIEEINAGGEGSSEENIRSAGEDLAGRVIEEISEHLARENNYEPNGSANGS